MRPPYRDDSPPPSAGRAADGEKVVYVARSTTGSWEDKQRSRSCAKSPQLLLGAWCFLILWLSVATLIASIIMMTLGHFEPWKVLCLVSAGLLVVSLAAALMISMNVKCPLCHGTPLHARHGCHKHRLADHWIPLTHRATVVLRMVMTLSFRCMYCGTPFRLFKKSSRHR